MLLAHISVFSLCLISEHILRWGLRGKKQTNHSNDINIPETIPTSGLCTCPSSCSRVGVHVTGSSSSSSSRSQLQCRLLGGVLLDLSALQGAPTPMHCRLESVFYFHDSASCHWQEFYLFMCVAALSPSPHSGLSSVKGRDSVCLARLWVPSAQSLAQKRCPDLFC